MSQGGNSFTACRSNAHGATRHITISSRCFISENGQAASCFFVKREICQMVIMCYIVCINTWFVLFELLSTSGTVPKRTFSLLFHKALWSGMRHRMARSWQTSLERQKLFISDASRETNSMLAKRIERAFEDTLHDTPHHVRAWRQNLSKRRRWAHEAHFIRDLVVKKHSPVLVAHLFPAVRNLLRSENISFGFELADVSSLFFFTHIQRFVHSDCANKHSGRIGSSTVRVRRVPVKILRFFSGGRGGARTGVAPLR